MTRLLLIAVMFALALPLQAAGPYRELKWEAMTPKGWDPMQELKDIDFDKLQDTDPRAMEVLDRIRKLWDAAPTEPSLNNAKVRLPGFVIPLERKGDRVTEFLLVPYFGACIHSPPPPANQIVHVVSKTPLKDMQTMTAIWASGTLRLHRSDSPWGAAGYRLELDRSEPYKAPPGRK